MLFSGIYDYISSVDADCEGALSYGLSAANIVRQMLSKAAECAGEYLDLSGIEDLIDKGEKKIKRLQNYQYEFDLFAQKMSDLESSMSTDLSTVMRETGDEVTADKCMELVVSDSEQRVKEMEDRSEYYQSNIDEILKKSAEKWTDADKKLVADMYKYAIEKHDDSMIKRTIEGCADESITLTKGDEPYNLLSVEPDVFACSVWLIDNKMEIQRSCLDRILRNGSKEE